MDHWWLIRSSMDVQSGQVVNLHHIVLDALLVKLQLSLERLAIGNNGGGYASWRFADPETDRYADADLRMMKNCALNKVARVFEEFVEGSS